jgi:hypothetical protein
LCHCISPTCILDNHAGPCSWPPGLVHSSRCAVERLCRFASTLRQTLADLHAMHIRLLS